MSALGDALVGGWQLTGIWRYHTGLPINFPEATGYNAVASQQASNAVRTRPVETSTADVSGYPSMFANPATAYQSFVNAMPCQQGDRNVFRLPHYSTMDAGLAKSFHLPRLESHVLQIRWEVFNLTNSQPFVSLVNRAIGQDPFASRPQSTWGRFGGSQTPVGESRPGRVMQFGMRYPSDMELPVKGCRNCSPLRLGPKTGPHRKVGGYSFTHCDQVNDWETGRSTSRHG
jgi:hypothetical protein